MLGIGLGQKGALVMIEPPRDLGRAGIFEVDYGVFVTVELLLVKQGASSVDEASKLEFRITANALAVKAGKQCRGGSAIKALVMIENAYSQCMPQFCRIPAGQPFIGSRPQVKS
jgi:hypothetical protein